MMTKERDQDQIHTLFELKKMEPATGNAVSEALSAFTDHQYQKAIDLLLPLLDQKEKISNLQLFLSKCYASMGQNRAARGWAFQECLDHPENRKAARQLSALADQVNGRFLDLEFNQTVWPAKHPSISLAMIVKNEEKDLPACLESYKDLVDEMIIIDTGSMDRTVEIAKSFGARVEFFEWNDDFAVARNESLKYATCDWILRTDADETILPAEKAKLLHAISSGLADIYICHTISRVGGKEKDGENVRLIRNHLGLQYESPLHENVDANAIRLGLTRARTNIFFAHNGYEVEQIFSEKIDRNLKILEKALQTNPEHFFVRLAYGHTLMQKDKKAGLCEYEKAIQNLPEDVSVLEYLGEAYCLLAFEYASQKNSATLNNIFHNMEIDFWFEPGMMQLEANLCLYHLGEFRKTQKLLIWALEQPGSTMFADFFSAETFNSKAMQTLLFECNVMLHENETALKVYKQLNPVKLPAAESLRISAKNLMNTQNWLKAYQTLLLAAALSDLTIQDYCDLAMCQSRLNNQVLAHVLIQEGRKLEPTSSALSNTETIFAMQENNPTLALEKSVEAFVYEPGNANYKSNLEKVSQVNQTSPVDALRKIGLEWLRKDETQKGLYALTIYLKFSPQDIEVQNIVSKFTRNT
jgi:glycosyltransferase involved in cell wall biosynthesis